MRHHIKSNKAVLSGALSAFTLAAAPVVVAYTHPGMPLTNADITQLNANKNTAPWSSGYASFSNPGESHTKLTYVQKGPFVEVNRTPDLNRNAFFDDMKAVQGLAMQWKFTGDSAYADKARTILLAWAGTHTTFGGAEGYLDAGDYIAKMTLGASILRSYSGWSAADTTTVKNYLNNTWWPTCSIPNPIRSANQGALQLKVGMGVAVYNDDTTKFNQVVTAFRMDNCGGLRNSLGNGQVGDSGRDQGHAYGQMQSLAWVAEVAWKAAGVDLFSQYSDRLKAIGEYYSNFNNGGTPSFIQAGTCYGLYPSLDSEGSGPKTSVTPDALHILHNAIVTRKGQSMPLLTAYRNNQTDNWETWFYRKSADTSTATAPGGISYPGASAVTGGLTVTAIGGATPAGSASYSGGTWTVNGAGTDIWGAAANDGFTYAYLPTTGDCKIVARVSTIGTTTAASKAGIIIRESLAGNSKMAAISVLPNGKSETSGRGYTASSHGAQAQSHNNVTTPYWIQIERLGNRVSCYDSPDGINWTAVKCYEFSMSTNAYIGLGFTSKVNGTLNTATFTNVAIGQ